MVTPNVQKGVQETSQEEHRASAVKMTMLARDLVEAGNLHFSSTNGMNTGTFFEFRAGLHHGPLSAGILGRSRRFYRIFGDTVVMAARMSQHTSKDNVQISSAVRSSPCLVDAFKRLCGFRPDFLLFPLLCGARYTLCWVIWALHGCRSTPFISRAKDCGLPQQTLLFVFLFSQAHAVALHVCKECHCAPAIANQLLSCFSLDLCLYNFARQ